jgi:hypothetical protein
MRMFSHVLVMLLLLPCGVPAGSTHSMQQWHRGPSGPGDERLLDQNGVGQAAGRLGQISNASEVQGGLMVSLEGWAAVPAPSRQRGNPADVAMVGREAAARGDGLGMCIRFR